MSAAGMLGAGMGLHIADAGGNALGDGDIPRRSLGRTGVQVSALGVGGHHLGDLATADEAIRLVHEAVDAGITFLDNAWEYYNGKTENLLGRALRGRRDKVVLMTKVCTHGRRGQLALEMLEESLRRLQTDHLDVWQIHGIVYDNDPELAYARGGVLEAFDLNPDGVRNQIEGNVVQTVSRTLKEQVTFYGAGLYRANSCAHHRSETRSKTPVA